MPIRWYTCPIVSLTLTDAETGQPLGPFRIPKVGAIVDPSTGRGYKFSGAADVGDWSVAFVRSDDFSALAADGQCVDLLEQGYEDADAILSLTPQQLGWSNPRLNRLRNRLEARGVDTTGLTNATPLSVWLDRLLSAVHPSFKSSGIWVR